MADPRTYLELAAFYQRKRDLLPRRAGAARGCGCCRAQGSYFQCVDYSAISELQRRRVLPLADREIGVAAIPLSAFYADGFEQRIARFCFAKKDETLDSGARAPGAALGAPALRQRA